MTIEDFNFDREYFLLRFKSSCYLNQAFVKQFFMVASVHRCSTFVIASHRIITLFEFIFWVSYSSFQSPSVVQFHSVSTIPWFVGRSLEGQNNMYRMKVLWSDGQLSINNKILRFQLSWKAFSMQFICKAFLLFLNIASRNHLQLNERRLLIS